MAALVACHRPWPDRAIRWYGTRRSLPWRARTPAWGVLVSEVMLQQTPVARVLPVWRSGWPAWPEPRRAGGGAGRGGDPAAWGRLGYPRRALRLHGCATAW